MARWSRFFKGFNPQRTALQAGTQAVEKLSSDTSLQTFTIAGDSGDSDVEVDSEGGETLTIAGGTNITTAEVGRTVTINASLLGDVVGPASAVDERIAVFDGTTGKLIKDGGKTVAEVDGDGDVVGPGSALDTAMCVFDGTTGKLIGVGTIQDTGAIVTFTGGDINMASLPDSDPSVLGQLYTDGTIGPATPKHLMVSGGP